MAIDPKVYPKQRVKWLLVDKIATIFDREKGV